MQYPKSDFGISLKVFVEATTETGYLADVRRALDDEER